MDESEVRALREEIYGRCSDETWHRIKDWWMQTTESDWLAKTSKSLRQAKDAPVQKFAFERV